MPKFQPKNSAEEDSREPETVLEIKHSSGITDSTTASPQNLKDPLEVFTSQFVIEELPSQFKPYPEGTRIIVDTYSYREIKIFSDFRVPADKIYEIMLRGIHVEGMDILLLTYFDFLYIGLLRKLASMGAKRFKVPYYCPGCRGEGTYYFDLNEVGFKTIEAEDLPINGNFRSIGQHRFSPLTIGDYIELYRSDRLYERGSDGKYIIKTNGKELIDASAIMAMMCLDNSFDEAYQIFQEVRDPLDRELLLQIDSLMDHGMEPLNFKCTNTMGEAKSDAHPSQVETCGRQLFMDLSGGESMIQPFREHGEANEPRISFGIEGNRKSA